MGKTMTRQVAEAIVSEAGDDVLNIARQYHNDLLRGVYPPGYVDCIVQKFRDAVPDFVDAFNFMHLHAAIRLGRIAVGAIEVGDTPYSDKNTEGNQQLLDRLPFPFKAKFWGGTQGEDGYVEWALPFRGVLNQIVDGNPYRGVVIIRPHQWCPLEVGTQSASKTLFQLHQAISTNLRSAGPMYHCLARWPYGSKHIFIFTTGFSVKSDPDFDKLRRKLKGPISSLLDPYKIWENDWVNPKESD